MDQVIARIAKEVMDIGTLETRNSDSLDFYDCGVWNIKAALEAAYKAGQESMKPGGVAKELIAEIDERLTSRVE
jgi:hypothetical protein